MACEDKVTFWREKVNLSCKSVHILGRHTYHRVAAVPYTEIMEIIVSDLPQL